jgi:hypothetical protein
MSIPLVQEATKDAINTSIIAIKRNIERINMLLGLVDSGSPDLSGLATKQELEDAITQVETDLTPVDEVTIGNMQSVTSNSVAEALGEWETVATDNSTYIIRGIETITGTYLQGHFQGTSQNVSIILPLKYRPKFVTRFFYFEENNSRVYFANILSGGDFQFFGGRIYTDFLVRIEKDI